MQPEPPVVQQEGKNFPLTKTAIFLVVGIIVLLSASAVLLMLNANKAKKMETIKPVPIETTAKKSVTPTLAPLSSDQADTTLSNSETDIQNALDQSDQDLKTLNQVDTTADNTSL